jgi:hypothetical protein
VKRSLANSVQSRGLGKSTGTTALIFPGRALRTIILSESKIA